MNFFWTMKAATRVLVGKLWSFVSQIEGHNLFTVENAKLSKQSRDESFTNAPTRGAHDVERGRRADVLRNMFSYFPCVPCKFAVFRHEERRTIWRTSKPWTTAFY